MANPQTKLSDGSEQQPEARGPRFDIGKTGRALAFMAPAIIGMGATVDEAQAQSIFDIARSAAQAVQGVVQPRPYYPQPQYYQAPTRQYPPQNYRQQEAVPEQSASGTPAAPHPVHKHVARKVSTPTTHVARVTQKEKPVAVAQDPSTPSAVTVAATPAIAESTMPVAAAAAPVTMSPTLVTQEPSQPPVAQPATLVPQTQVSAADSAPFIPDLNTPATRIQIQPVSDPLPSTVEVRETAKSIRIFYNGKPVGTPFSKDSNAINTYDAVLLQGPIVAPNSEQASSGGVTTIAKDAPAYVVIMAGNGSNTCPAQGQIMDVTNGNPVVTTAFNLCNTWDSLKTQGVSSDNGAKVLLTQDGTLQIVMPAFKSSFGDVSAAGVQYKTGDDDQRQMSVAELKKAFATLSPQQAQAPETHAARVSRDKKLATISKS